MSKEYIIGQLEDKLKGMAMGPYLRIMVRAVYRVALTVQGTEIPGYGLDELEYDAFLLQDAVERAYDGISKESGLPNLAPGEEPEKVR